MQLPAVKSLSVGRGTGVGAGSASLEYWLPPPCLVRHAGIERSEFAQLPDYRQILKKSFAAED